MPFSTETFNGDGSNRDFAVNMPYIDRSHITLLVSEVSVTFVWVNATLIRADVAPAAGSGNVVVKRTTPISSPLVDYEDGSTPTEADFDNSNLQNIYALQEQQDADSAKMSKNSGATAWVGESLPISSVAAGTASTDAINKSQLDAVVAAAGNVPTPANPGDDGKVITAGGGAFSWLALPPSIANLSEDTTPQLGGDLDLNGNAIDFPSTPNISDVLDEDNMVSDSAVALATQQSIKAYVDGQFTAAAWTPVLTFATPGDLSVAYTTQTGAYKRIGDVVFANFVVDTSTFTHSTAAGALRITGLPVTSAVHTARGGGTGRWHGITAGNFNHVTAVVLASSTIATIQISGEGLTSGDVTAAAVPTGGPVYLEFQLVYFAA